MSDEAREFEKFLLDKLQYFIDKNRNKTEFDYCKGMEHAIYCVLQDFRVIFKKDEK